MRFSNNPVCNSPIFNLFSRGCDYSCKFYIDCEGEVNARIIALHFNWAAIYDNRTMFDCKEFSEVNIELPKRNYRYILRTYFFNEEYGTSQKVIEC